ncbi:MAG: hypothetical protein ACRCZI_04620 [Cetobacterium sp.]
MIGLNLVIIIIVIVLLLPKCLKPTEFFGTGPLIFEPDNYSPVYNARYILEPVYRRITAKNISV